MADTATSPPYHRQIRASRPSTTSTSSPSMAPFLSPQLVSTPPPMHPQHQPPPTISQQGSSPNYFGFQNEGNSFSSDSPRHVKSNWSPPSSAVRSTAGVSPSFVPADQNPDFDAFRRQSDSNKSFGVGGLNGFKISMPGQRPVLERPASIRSPGSHGTVKPQTQAREVPPASHRTHLDPSTSDLSRSPKRMLSSSALGEAIRRGSPASFVDSDEPALKSPKSSSSPESMPRFELSLNHMNGLTSPTKSRRETPSEANDSSAQTFITPERLVDLMSTRPQELLVLDLRVSTQYAAAHITSALSLCIPTTLLKRPAFDVRKLADTFQDDQARRRFENWRQCYAIVIYDSNSAALKDATTCVNMTKKFRSEGYEGAIYIVKGGFLGFSKRFPSHVQRGFESRVEVDGDGPKVAPVVGGCPMPSTNAPANPFFGNIRQNMDLIGGVGQIPLQHPKKASAAVEDEYPAWLKQASEVSDQGKQVSSKFERIERREKKRMEDALSGSVSYGTPGSTEPVAVQIAGLEKGSKNRYNNIWPFEHSRVRLQGVSNQGCDYFNASHIKSSHSHKSYISTQAPIPATFNDFWNVVWQQDVRVIVMLTAEKEGAQVKAHNYWDQKQYGPLHLEFLSEKRASLELDRIHKHHKRPQTMHRLSTRSVFPGIPLAQLDGKADESEKTSEQPYVLVRKFTLKHEKHPFEPMREVTQLQYSGWPDFGAPAHPAHLLGLVEQCDAVVRATNKTSAMNPEQPNKRPILVHCSAGCGRTGTFCTVDSVIDMLKRQRISRAAQSASPQSMDVDQKSRQSSHNEAATNDFFSSKKSSSTASGSDDSVEGSWVGRDDLDLVERTVEDFRHQRLSMVQSLRQFVLCYESIMEWLVDQDELHHSA